MRRRGREKPPDSNTEFNTTEDECNDEEPVPKRPQATTLVHESKVGFLGKVRKAAWRSLFGTMMMGAFGFIISCGHVYVCLMVFMLQCCLFGELVGVRKKMAAERKIPLFRSIQWAWFFTAAFWTWSDGMFTFLRETPLRRQMQKDSAQIISRILEKSALISLALYSTLMIVSVLSLRKGLYRYQMTQYSWTLVTCAIVVFQMRAVFQTIYSGLFWFVLPCSLVICNDIMAYFSGVLFGRRLTSRPLLELSPNKTWEGFLGSAFCTLIFAWYFSGFLSQFPLMVCIPDTITLGAQKSSCTPDEIYQLKPFLVDAQDQFFPRRYVAIVAQMLQWRSVAEWQVCDAQFHALALGTFASFVSPFGGFVASAIKRAYGIKDFAAVIPGHGGMMDRFDCQFVMAMCTYVHIMTFCRMQAAPSVDALLSVVMQLRPEERLDFARRLQDLLAPESTRSR